MPKRRRTNDDKQVNIRTGNFSDISGTVNVAGGEISTQQTTINSNVQDIERLFDQLYASIESRAETSSAHKEDLKAEVQEIQSVVTDAAKKNEKVDESFLSRRFRNIARMAPDVLDVVTATLVNPLAGLGVAVKKIADRAKEDV